jgi:hypothetical protein
VVLVSLVLVACALRAVAALALPTPFIFPDEGAYALLGRALWRHGDLAVLGGPSQYESALYPVVSAMPYGLLRVLQALALCGTGVVVYAWARALVRPGWAFSAAALTLALPGLVYAGTIVAEALLLPLATVTGWLAIRAIAEPALKNQAALAAALVASVVTRAEACALVLALLAATVVVERVRALWPTWVAVAAVAVTWLALGGASPLRSLGGYDGAGEYSAHRVLVWILQEGGALLLACGAVPLCAAVLLSFSRGLDLQTRATLAFAIVLASVAVVEAGVFAAGHADRLLERQFLFAIPPLFVAFAAWLDHGAPRAPTRAVLVVVAMVAALLAMPFGRLANDDAATDNPTLVPLTHIDSPKVYGVVALFALGAAAITLTVPRRHVWLLPALLTAIFVATAVSASIGFADRSDDARRAYSARTAGWVNRDARGDTTYLYDGAHDYRIVWSQLFWNGRITRVIDHPATHVPGPLGQEQLQIVRDDGVLRLVAGAVPRTPFVVAPTGFSFRGTRISRAGRVGLALSHVEPPLRLRTWVQGVLPNGDVLQGGVATLDVFDCGRGTFHVVAIGRDNETVKLSHGANEVATTTLWPDGVWEQTLQTPANGHRCTFALSTTSLLHLATFAWTPG